MSNLDTLRNTIEDLPRYHQIEILTILKQYSDICINENNNGTFVNLTQLDSEVIVNLEKYISYVNEQKTHLDIIEKEKARIEKVYFNKDSGSEKDNKDNKDN